MIAAPQVHPFTRVIRMVRPRMLRTYREFAEAEIVMPEGPFKGLPYSCDRMPFTRELLDEFSRGRYTDFYGSGPAQGSKTLHFCVIPTLFHLFEAEEDVTFGAPTVQQAKASFESRIRPAIEASPRYRGLLPTRGGGSRGGVADSIRFLNGALLRFLGAGGGDHQLSSYTSRVIVATELDKMDDAGGGSEETDPVSKLKARSSAFGPFARFFGECTMSTKGGRIYREVVELGTDSRVFLPCPHCRRWIWPERQGLVGWQGAADEMEAREKARFQCPECSAHWTEADRRTALRDPRIVARGQAIDSGGRVVGDAPRTYAYGFRWNCMASPLKRMEDVAAKEWKSERSGLTTDEKELVQFEWVLPFEENFEDLIRPDEKTILSKITDNPTLLRGVVPAGTVKLTLGVDVGSYVIWYALMAWMADCRGHVVDFRGVNVPDSQRRDPLKILALLKDILEKVVKPGWGGRQPDRVLVDSGYEQEAVYAFVRDLQPRYLACKGFGTNSRNGMWKTDQAAEPTKIRGVGNEWKYVLQPTQIRLVAVHSDHWRSLIHDGFWAPRGAPGSIEIFHGGGDPGELREHGIFARQIVAEQREYRETQGRERKLVWVVKSRINHYLDCLTYARCAADIEGVRLAPRPPASIVAAPAKAIQKLSSIRTTF